eukprot:700397-Pelagomonas_calceolata.AAC.1
MTLIASASVTSGCKGAVVYSAITSVLATSGFVGGIDDFNYCSFCHIWRMGMSHWPERWGAIARPLHLSGLQVALANHTCEVFC